MRDLPGLFPCRVGSAALIGALLLGVAAWAMAAEPKQGGTLKFIPHADLKVLDPVWTTAYIVRNHRPSQEEGVDGRHPAPRL